MPRSTQHIRPDRLLSSDFPPSCILQSTSGILFSPFKQAFLKCSGHDYINIFYINIELPIFLRRNFTDHFLGPHSGLLAVVKCSHQRWRVNGCSLDCLLWQELGICRQCVWEGEVVNVMQSKPKLFFFSVCCPSLCTAVNPPPAETKTLS